MTGRFRHSPSRVGLPQFYRYPRRRGRRAAIGGLFVSLKPVSPRPLHGFARVSGSRTVQVNSVSPARFASFRRVTFVLRDKSHQKRAERRAAVFIDMEPSVVSCLARVSGRVRLGCPGSPRGRRSRSPETRVSGDWPTGNPAPRLSRRQTWMLGISAVRRVRRSCEKPARHPVFRPAGGVSERRRRNSTRTRRICPAEELHDFQPAGRQGPDGSRPAPASPGEAAPTTAEPSRRPVADTKPRAVRRRRNRCMLLESAFANFCRN